MFIGGCAGSTAGGVKVVRFWIALKVLVGHLEKAYRPSVVRPIKVGGSTLDDEQTLASVAFVLAFILMAGLGGILIESFEPDEACDVLTAMTASLACLANVGPGLGHVGAIENYEWMTPASKIFLSICMALGRLEFFAILVLFTPRFWRGD